MLNFDLIIGIIDYIVMINIEEEIMEFQVMILGPRAVGKTTMLSLILDELEKELNRYDCELILTEKDKEMFMKSYESLKSMLDSTYDIKHDIESTSKIKKYNIKVKNIGINKELIDLNIIDHPGGYFSDNTKDEKLTKLYSNSDMVLHILDSPYFMEENGVYNDERNSKEVLLNFIKSSELNKKEKIIIFIPLKCEKYDEISIESNFSYSYSDVIELCEKHEKINYHYVPVETVGGIVFKEFEYEIDTKIPNAIFTRKYPNSDIKINNISKVTRILINEFMKKQSNEKKIILRFLKTKRAESVKEIINEIERVI